MSDKGGTQRPHANKTVAAAARSNGDDRAAYAPGKNTGSEKNTSSEKLGNISLSLRKAYQDTLEESVPDTMMDLLRRLG